MKNVVRCIEPLDEDELEKDLRFLYHNRSETVDQFVDQAIALVKYHTNEAMIAYQERLINDVTNGVKGEIAGIVLRSRRETIYHKPEADNDW